MYAHLFSRIYDAHLWILERTPRMMMLRWLQPGRCHYGEQRWILITARRAGTCALSGARIKVGARVYRPADNASLISAGVQILASELAGVDIRLDESDGADHTEGLEVNPQYVLP